MADFFRTRRVEAGLTQLTVSERSMSARSFIAAIESGTMIPSTAKAVDIARACAIPFDEFMSFWEAWKKVKMEELEDPYVIRRRWEEGERAAAARHCDDQSVQDMD